MGYAGRLGVDKSVKGVTKSRPQRTQLTSKHCRVYRGARRWRGGVTAMNVAFSAYEDIAFEFAFVQSTGDLESKL